MILNLQVCYKCAMEFNCTLPEAPVFSHSVECGICGEISEVSEDWIFPEVKNEI